MSSQIAIRLPDDVVRYIDEQITEGRARSRADLIGRALAREMRRERAARDLEIILADQIAGDFDRLAAHAADTKLDLD